MSIPSVGGSDFNARIQEITARIASLKAGVPGTQTTSSTTATGATTTTTSSSTLTKSGSAFDLALQQANGVQASGKLNSAGIPVELARYGNGKIPANALQSVGVGNHQLWAPAAQAFTQMKADAARAGVTIGVTDSYRSYDQQVDLAKRKGLYSQGGLAAKPGTSDHGWGRSMDLDLNPKALAWMRANGEKYGFDENVPRESWHWTFTPKKV